MPGIQILLVLGSPVQIFRGTLSEHMRLVSQSGPVRSKRIKQWIFYQRNEDRIGAVKALVLASL